MGTDIKELTKSKTKSVQSGGKVIFLHNDDYNSFDHVEKCLINICKHSPEQAAQCSLIVHYRGKCDVKRGNEEELRKIYLKLKSQLLTVTLEDN